MKQVLLLLILLFFGMTNVYGQQEGSYISVSAKAGSGGLDYKLNSLKEKGDRSSGLGCGLDIAYSYYFDMHWGVSAGAGVSRYISTGKLKGGITGGSYYSLGTLIDDDFDGRPREFELRARISNLEERQSVFFVDVPVQLMYQTRFGEDRKWGLYGGLGAKLQLPFSTKFKIKNGAGSEFNVSGKYDGIPTDMGSPSEPPVPQHGYGTIKDPNASLDWNDGASLKMGVAGTVDMGILFSIGEDTDLMVGGYLDYGFVDMKKNGNQKLFTAPASYHPGADNKIGNGIIYNGMLNSDVTDKVKPIAFGLKVSVRFKLSNE